MYKVNKSGITPVVSSLLPPVEPLMKLPLDKAISTGIAVTDVWVAVYVFAVIFTCIM